jgi:hypothetical protein
MLTNRVFPEVRPVADPAPEPTIARRDMTAAEMLAFVYDQAMGEFLASESLPFSENHDEGRRDWLRIAFQAAANLPDKGTFHVNALAIRG